MNVNKGGDRVEVRFLFRSDGGVKAGEVAEKLKQSPVSVEKSSLIDNS